MLNASQCATNNSAPLLFLLMKQFNFITSLPKKILT